MIDPLLQEWICDNIDGALYVGSSVGKSKLWCYKVSTFTSWIICMCLLVLEYTPAIAVSVSHWNNTTCLVHSLSHLAAARSIAITFFTAMTAADQLSGHFYWYQNDFNAITWTRFPDNLDWTVSHSGWGNPAWISCQLIPSPLAVNITYLPFFQND